MSRRRPSYRVRIVATLALPIATCWMVISLAVHNWMQAAVALVIAAVTYRLSS